MKVDPNMAANPAYEAVKCDQEDHTYDVVSEGVASRQRRGEWLLYMYIFYQHFYFHLFCNPLIITREI